MTRATPPLLRGGLQKRRLLVVLLLLVFQTVVLLVSSSLDPDTAKLTRGLVTPPLFFVTLGAGYALGLRVGMALATYTAFLAYFALDLSIAAPILWIALVLPSTLLGERVRTEAARANDALRQVDLLQRTLRQGLTPPKAIAEVTHARVAAVYRPATRLLVGGDFYGVVERPNGDAHDTHLIVGDVAGHGADSAAIGVQLRACWRALVEADVPIQEIAKTMNRILLSRPAADFATAVLLQVCPTERTLHLVNAGHPAPLLVRGDGIVEPLPQGIAPPLGVKDDVQYAALDVTLPPVAWSLVAYSDGLVEGRGAARRAFPPSALVRTLAAFGPPLAQRDLQELLLLADTATGGTLQDDVVILALSPEDAGVPA
jgi:hypothetical protein